MVSQLRAGVVGAGVFGAHHAAKYALMPGLTLAGVCDPHPDRSSNLAERFGGRAFADLPSLLAEVDVVSVASPASFHAAAALAALSAGVHVYVEKPLATDLEAADSIVALAARRGLVAACGFLERGALSAIGLPRDGAWPLVIEATRRNPPSRRNQDVSVVMDLMIHDLDLALLLSGSAPLTVEAEGDQNSGRHLDTASAEVTFENGVVAILEASRVASTPQRNLRLVYPAGEVNIDLVAGAVTNRAGLALNGGFDAGLDRLGLSLAAFVAAVRGEAARPLADAVDGARALDLALAVEQAVGG